MTSIDTTTTATTYERRAALAMDADERQSRIIADVQRAGFEIDWNDVLRSMPSSSPVDTIERRIAELFRSDAFRETIATLGINGKLLSTFIQRETDRLAGFTARTILVPLEFSEAAVLGEPESAIEYWTRVLNLSEAQVAEIEKWLRGFENEMRATRARVTETLMSRVTELYSKAVEGSQGVDEFLRQAREVLPSQSKALLETEYRTHLSTVYAKDRHQQIVSRSAAFPFTQFHAIIDSRTTEDICLPMGTAGPKGTGYIAATEDAIWFKWRCPAHWRCRSSLSPIGYRECQRLGILAKDGKTKIALVGSNPMRPFGEPPDVEPQEGFGG